MLTLTDVIVSFWMAPVILFILLPLSMLVCSWVIALMKKTAVDPKVISASEKKVRNVTSHSLQTNAAT